MSGKVVRYLVRATVFATFVIVLISAGAWWWHAKILHAGGPHANDTIVLIASGDGHATIRWTLKRAGVIDELYVYDAARLLAGNRFHPKAGEYLIPAHVSVAGILDIIHAGRSYQRRLTVVEGLRSYEVAQLLEQNEFLQGDLDIPIPEGSILPETYFFTHGTARSAIVNRMQQKRDMVVAESWADRHSDLPLKTAEEAVILASLIERESSDPDERRLVAGVFANRLKRGMRLQSDPTVLYGISSSPDRSITQSDLKRKTDWNTYMMKGLPKTAICNPGEDAIRAAMNPAKTSYLYFVSDAKGGLMFAKTLDAHNRNVRVFRKAMRDMKQDQ